MLPEHEKAIQMFHEGFVVVCQKVFGEHLVAIIAKGSS